MALHTAHSARSCPNASGATSAPQGSCPKETTHWGQSKRTRVYSDHKCLQMPDEHIHQNPEHHQQLPAMSRFRAGNLTAGLLIGRANLTARLRLSQAVVPTLRRRS